MYGIVYCSLLFTCLLSSVEAGQSDLASGVESAWDKRSSAISSLYFSWDVVIKFYAAPDGPIEATGEFAMDRLGQNQLRWRFSVMNVNLLEGREFLQQQSLKTFDGGENSVLFFADSPTNIPVASIEREERGLSRDVRVLPIRLVYMPFDATDGVFAKQQWENQARTVFEDVNCIVLSSGLLKVWVTDSADHIPIRFTEDWETSGAVRLDYRMKYAVESESSLPVLSGWEYKRFSQDGESVVDNRSVSVTAATINELLDDKLFKQEKFPHGTWVNDTVLGKSYLVRDPKPDRIIEEFESIDNYEQTLSSDSAIELEPKTRSVLLLLILNVAVITILLMVWWRRSAAMA